MTYGCHVFHNLLNNKWLIENRITATVSVMLLMSILFTAHSSKYAMQADNSSKEITLVKGLCMDKSTHSSCFCSKTQCSDLRSGDLSWVLRWTVIVHSVLDQRIWKVLMHIFGRVQEGELFLTKHLNKCWTLYTYLSWKMLKRRHNWKDIEIEEQD